MRKIILLSLFVALMSSFVKAGGKYGYGVSFAPSLSFVSFKGEELAVQINKDAFKSYANSILWNGTFFIERKFPRTALGIGLGLGYRNFKEQTEAVINNIEQEETTLTYNHDYGTIPMYLRIKLTKKWYLKTGVTSLVNLQNSVTTVITALGSGDKSEITSSAGDTYKTFNFSGDVGVGYTFVNKKIKMDLEPTFSHNLMGMLSGDVDVNAFQSAIGLAMNIRL